VQLLSVQDLGEATLDLRHRVLPMCEPAAAGCPTRGATGDLGFGGSGHPAWVTPTVVVPFTRGAAVVAQVVLSFSVNVDPTALLLEADRAEQLFVEKVADHVEGCIQSPVGYLREGCSAGAVTLCGIGPTDDTPVPDRAPTVVEVNWPADPGHMNAPS
jgi:hypothetical protein